MKSKKHSRCFEGLVAVVASTLMLIGSAQAEHKFQILHRFLAKPAFSPFAALVADSAGNLYGTSLYGWGSNCVNQEGCGVVFKLSRDSNGEWTYTIIHRFTGNDGALPYGGLIFDSSGNLYGTTELGGFYNAGTVFELSPSRSKWTERVLYSFGRDLICPLSTLTLDTRGNLYGTASGGGIFPPGAGGVFKLSRSGNHWKETVLYEFKGSDGGSTFANVVLDSVGNLYGTTPNGGQYGEGLVFKLSPSGNGYWTENMLHSFCSLEYCADGSYPQSGVIFDAAGNIYGTTRNGGNNCAGYPGCGRVYKLTPSNDAWTLSVLYAFDELNGPQGFPWAGLTFDLAGSLYGTTLSALYGVVFKLSQSSSGWTETVLRSFNGFNGMWPYGGVVLDRDGVVYGTTAAGGYGFYKDKANGDGVVFSIKP